jgi:hypothetical protein
MFQAFSSCVSLVSLTEIDASNINSAWRVFDGNTLSYFTDFGGFKNMKVSYSLSPCPALTHESLMNCINGLFDLTGLTAQTLTLGSINLGKLQPEEIAIATQKNWTIA